MGKPTIKHWCSKCDDGLLRALEQSAKETRKLSMWLRRAFFVVRAPKENKRHE